MRTLALDIGKTRIGLAVSDDQGRIATPLKVMDADVVLDGQPEFRHIIEDWGIEQLVCGLPYTLAGEEGPQAGSIKARAKLVAATFNLPLYFVDERLSSKDAKRILREEGLSEQEMRGKVDMIAASLFLQAWLDMPKDGVEPLRPVKRQRTRSRSKKDRNDNAS